MGKQAALKLEDEAPRPPDTAESMQVHLVPLDQIRPAPWNPPARMDPQTVEELADSIATVGQQIPTLIRPVDQDDCGDCDGCGWYEGGPTLKTACKTCGGSGKTSAYEMVFGHRRLAAMHLLAGRSFTYAAAHRDPDGAITIKAFVREMSEEEAMILSGIENLQRQGFSDIEEAEFFRAAGQRYGESAVKILAEKLSVSDRYIRKRVAILDLPNEVLDLWKSGTWHVGHLEQLLRLGGNDEVIEFVGKMSQYYQHRTGGLGKMQVYEVKERIDQLAIPLSHARFDKAGCRGCIKNTQCQLTLWGGDKDKTKCLDQKCFQERQQAWLDVNWADCKANKYGTQAVIIGDAETKSTGSLSEYGGPKATEKCLVCARFASIVNLKLESFYGSNHRVCMGDKNCFASVKAEQSSGTSKNKPVDPDSPRVDWHGEFFRQEFYQQQVPGLLDGLITEDNRRLQIVLACLIFREPQLSKWLCEKLGIDPPKFEYDWQFRMSLQQIIERILPLKPLEIEYLAAEACIQAAFVIKQSFTDLDRQAIAELLGIDFSRYQVTSDYLQKKTRGELITFILRDSGLLQEQAFRKQIGLPWDAAEDESEEHRSKIQRELGSYKKDALVSLILNCGVDLHGRLPREIADRPKLGGNQ